eukprot:gnl/MRDRNA2_/MRDRNA2_92660_c0_seq1.p1 gnl/MRDRNA2_/MRDRNA2_92660_c0~~gnl/MRDRNA2_/MRDRNA2_92660_c0_seq1.p1  ORF type:complete len:538 (-),score=123.29 gnl/MRDRNA2_/MRDRNA2_92660_c0_seq1:98-1711(-)
MGSMERLVQLFIQSMDPENDGTNQPKAPSPEGIDKAIGTIEEMLSSDHAIASGTDPAGTWCLLAMALEDKPGLADGSIRCYEKTLEKISNRKNSWELCVTLEQLGKVCMQNKRRAEAERHLLQCVTEVDRTPGHPRDEDLFQGGFSTKQTKRQFQTTLHKLLAKLYLDQQRMDEVRHHYALAQKFDAAVQQQDAVEAQLQREASGSSSAPSKAYSPPVDDIARLWKATPESRKNLRNYHYSDEGSTVSALLDLNEHLGLQGTSASEAVSSLRQFRVTCEEDKCDVLLRLESDGCVKEFRLLLYPLSHEIIPEDTVPKLRGKPEKRRLEVKLFKKEKKITWRGLTDETESGKKKLAKELGKDTREKVPEKATHMNPLTEEEIASLPKPSDVRAPSANRPSGWSKSGGYADEERQPVTSQPKATPQQQKQPVVSQPKATSQPQVQPKKQEWPTWIGSVEEQSSPDSVDILVQLADDYSSLTLKDLELDVHPVSGVRLQLQSNPSDGVVSLPVPPGTNGAEAAAKWRKKTRTLEIRFPIA